MAGKRTMGNVIAPPRFLVFLGLLAAGSVGFIPAVGLERGMLIGFDLAALVFLLTSAPMLKRQAAELRETAARNDANRWLLLVISLLLSLVVMTAIIAQIGGSEPLQLSEKLLIVATLVLVWTFANAIYAFHYAHLYYLADAAGDDCKGLLFPGGDEPGMADFVYFAYTLGVAVQTSDVAVTSPHLRRVVTVHCIAGFFFNLGVLALAISVLGSR